MAVRYFRGHGPTTRQDFAGWTGLTATDTKRAIAAAGDRLAEVPVDGVTMFAHPAVQPPPARRGRPRMLALPGFDEYLLGFKDRSMMLAEEHKKAVIPGGNGVFQPTVVRAGRVVGTWRRTVARSGVRVQVAPLTAVPATERRAAGAALAAYGDFLELPAEVRWTDEPAGGSADS